jgi:hypothetical protein
MLFIHHGHFLAYLCWHLIVLYQTPAVLSIPAHARLPHVEKRSRGGMHVPLRRHSRKMRRGFDARGDRAWIATIGLGDWADVCVFDKLGFLMAPLAAWSLGRDAFKAAFLSVLRSCRVLPRSEGVLD